MPRGDGVWGAGDPLSTEGEVWGGRSAPSPKIFLNFFVEKVFVFWCTLSGIFEDDDYKTPHYATNTH